MIDKLNGKLPQAVLNELPLVMEKFGISKDAELFDPVTNAQAAYYMTGRGTDFSSWGYGPGAYDGDPSEPGITKWFDDFPKN